MEMRRADRIAETLEGLIFSGEFSDGDRLDEHRLAERFGVSRTPIREAFQRLALSGLVEAIPRRGVFVRQPGIVELMDMFEVMAEFEGICGRLASSRISDDALAALNDANARCREAVEAGETDAYYRENERFHHIIYRQSGNAFLEGEASRLHRRLKPFRRVQLQLRGRLMQSMSEHEGIVKALTDADAEAAARLLREHVAVQGEKFHHLMASLKSAAE
ncbi:GntR family transcriptional regulator [Meridianimarinicoccus roseus]|uniref:GntR family transcriptional regulator n=1 Tax=Meridianimarinicoccus roseus TaxID=2072018 RepID=A0A2V2LBQ0_9RHOB|nr:GntR family transcriptional regulator [Meridianimarinicoccus roseus]PWR02612.1 GntR family transcriptional regulator [Meridianimarinicoccus roseus]